LTDFVAMRVKNTNIEMMGIGVETQVSTTNEKNLAIQDCVATGAGTDSPLSGTRGVFDRNDLGARSAFHGSCPPLPLNESSSNCTVELRLAHPATYNTQSIEEKTEDEKVIEPSSLGCVSLPSRHLASILTLLDGAHVQWPTKSPIIGSYSSGTDATTTVTSNLTGVNSLDREFANSILSSEGSLVVSDSTDLKHHSYEMNKLRRDLETVTRERDLLRERDLQHAESLNILKQEINSLTLAKISSPSSFSSELEQLRLENEIFAAQIVENEVEIREIRSLLECLDTENRQIRNDLEAVRGKVNGNKVGTKIKVDPESSIEARSLKDQIKDLTSRVTEIERARIVLEGALEKEMTLRSEETKAIKCVVREIKDATASILTSHPNTGDSSGEGFEVTMDGHVSIDPNGGNKDEQSNKALEMSRCDSSKLLGACNCCQFMTHDD
jgi:hypothetical protein